MATNMFKKYTEAQTEEWDVPAGTKAGDLVVHAISAQVGVALASRGDATISHTNPDGTVTSGIPNGGIGYKANTAVVARDGQWLFTIATVVNGDSSLPAGASGRGTPAKTPVYKVAGSQTFTLVSAGNTLVGRIADGQIVAGVAPIRIGTV